MDTDLGVKLENPCAATKDFCVNCHSHFVAIRPLIKTVVISKHFLKDLKSEDEARSIVKDILDCINVDFTELHKFEEKVDGALIFRAKKEGVHFVYCVDKKMRIIFMRAFRNFGEYERFLGDKKEIRKMIMLISDPDEQTETNTEEQAEDKALKAGEKRKKARRSLRI